MSIKYSAAELRNPHKPDEPAKFYAKAQVREEVGFNKLTQEISYATSLTDSDVASVLRALIYRIKQHLADGDMVNLDEFGKFRYQISSEGAVSKEALTHHYIKKVKVHFRPGKMLRPAVPDLEFERVVPVRVREETRKKEYSS